MRIIYKMFTLVTDRSKYYKVKRGQSAAEIERELKIPARCAFAGAVIPVYGGLTVYRADVGDTYRTVAVKFKTDEARLREINGGKPVYPTCKLFVPCK